MQIHHTQRKYKHLRKITVSFLDDALAAYKQDHASVLKLIEDTSHAFEYAHALA